MKKLLIVLLFCTYGGMLSAFEYHFPNNGMKIHQERVNYDRERGKFTFPFNNFTARVETILEITFDTKKVGYQSIKKTLSKIDKMPRDYTRFYEILTRYTSSSPYLAAGNYTTYFPDGVVGYYDNALKIIERDFKRAVKNLKIGEEQDMLRLRLFPKSEENFRREVSDLDISYIKIQLKLVPTVVIMKCKRINKQIANCWFVDEDGQEVEEVVEQWDISYPADLEKKIKQKTRGDEQMKEKRKQLLEKECPSLYRTLYNAQQGYYISPSAAMKAAKRFEELGCSEWLQ